MKYVVIERYGSGGHEKRIVSDHETITEARKAVREYNQARADGLRISLRGWINRVTGREGERWVEMRRS